MILTPSDLVLPRGHAPRELLAVGGRIVAVDGCHLVLADALASVVVALAQVSEQVAVGALVVVEGCLAPGGHLEGHLLGVWHGDIGGAASETYRLISQGVGRRLEAFHRARLATRDYFDSQGFLEVRTPTRVRTPGLDANVNAVEASGDWLVTSPELQMKRLLVGGLPRIYQFAVCSRMEELGPWHEPEFLLLEWYRAFADYSSVMADTEQIVARVVQTLSDEPVLRMADGRRIDVSPPFERMTVREAFRRHADVADAVALAAHDEPAYFARLVDRVEPALARHDRPVFLTHYPISQAALARPCPEDPSVAERFELYLAGIELCNGFGELTDPTEQRHRFQAERRHRRIQGEPTYRLDRRFLQALEEGMPPSAGNALGFERLVALAAGVQAIADVMAGPTAWI